MQMWLDEFFSTDKIPRTLNLLVKCKGNTIHNLCDLAVNLNTQGVLPALTTYGLQPFANDHTYVLKYADMDASQLRVVKSLAVLLSQEELNIYCHYSPENMYLTFPVTSTLYVNDASILYGVGVLCILNESSVTQHLTQTILDKLLDMIINSCTMRIGAVNEAMNLLQEFKQGQHTQYYKAYRYNRLK